MNCRLQTSIFHWRAYHHTVGRILFFFNAAAPIIDDSDYPSSEYSQVALTRSTLPRARARLQPPHFSQSSNMAKRRVNKKVELNFDALKPIHDKYQAFAGDIHWTWRYVQPNPLEAPKSQPSECDEDTWDLKEAEFGYIVKKEDGWHLDKNGESKPILTDPPYILLFDCYTDYRQDIITLISKISASMYRICRNYRICNEHREAPFRISPKLPPSEQQPGQTYIEILHG